MQRCEETKTRRASLTHIWDYLKSEMRLTLVNNRRRATVKVRLRFFQRRATEKGDAHGQCSSRFYWTGPENILQCNFICLGSNRSRRFLLAPIPRSVKSTTPIPLLPCKGHCLSYLVLYQNHVLIVCMIQDQLFHTYRPKVFTDN
jgi:hypothetical protein